MIIDIDDESIYKEGRWPWPRDKLGRLLLKLQEAGVVVVAMDIVMSDPEVNYAIGLKEKLQHLPPASLANPTELTTTELTTLLDKIAPQVDNDQTFAHAMLDYEVVLGFLFHNISDVKKGQLPEPLTNDQGELLHADQFASHSFKGYTASLELFMKSARHGGFVTNLPDSDGIIRQGLLLASYDNKVYPSLALMTAMRYSLAEHVNLKTRKETSGRIVLFGIDIAGTFIPTNGQGQILIPFWGPPGTLDYYSATNILQGKVPASALEGGIAIIGSSTVMLADLHPTPVAKSFPGVEMVANMITAMLGQQVSTKYDWHSVGGLAGLALLGFLYAVLFPFVGVASVLLITLSSVLIVFGLSMVFFVWKNLYIPTASLVILITLQAMVNYSYEFILEKRQKYKIKQLFGQYVPETYVKALLDAREHSSMEGENRHMTVFFSDIRDFTSTSETLDAAGVKRLLNTFFTPITEIIFNNQGTIDKYVGDMVVAFWGAPIPISDKGHAYYAIKAALEILKALPAINENMIAKGLPTVDIGIGLGSGFMNVGDMGSQFRRAYTVLGDVVNLASRLESLTKFYHVNMLVNDETRLGQDDFLWRTIDKVLVKGRSAIVTIYQPLGLLDDMSLESITEAEDYRFALDAYYAQDWVIAEKWFLALQQCSPSTYLYQLYLERIHVFKTSPPPAEWTGVYTHTQK